MNLHAYEIKVSCEITSTDPPRSLKHVKSMLIEVDEDGVR
jgi:hypothetical protein